MGYIIVQYTEKTLKKSKLFSAFDKDKCVAMAAKYKKNKIARKISNICFYIRIVKKCGDNDVIISWDLHKARNIYLISRLLRKHVKILGMNFLDHVPDGIKAKIKTKVYNKMFADPNFYITVNCMNYVEIYEKRYKMCRERIFELKDSNMKLDFNSAEFSYGNGTIFSGGKLRDWDTYIKAAKLLPQYKFIVVRGDSFNYKCEIPENVEIYQNINGKLFNELLKNCSISVTVLPSTVPNGFTVLIQSACLNRPIIAPDCVAVNELLYDPVNDLWGGVTYKLKDPEDLAKKIDMLYKDLELRKKLCANMAVIVKSRDVMQTSKKLLEYADKILSADTN